MDVYNKIYDFISGDNNDYEEPFADEVTWTDDDHLYVWIPYFKIDDFMDEIQEQFGDIIPEGGIAAVMWDDCIVFNLCDVFNKSGLEKIYKKPVMI